MREEKELFEIVQDETKSNNEKVDAFIGLSHIYNERGKLSDALKYAAMATIATPTPRADACCCIGDVYLEFGESTWAMKWYEHAISNTSDKCDFSFYTWIPLLKIAQCHLLMTNYDKTEEYISAAEKLAGKDNREIIDFRNSLAMIKKILNIEN